MNESGGDVLPGFGVGKNPGSWVVDILEPVQGFTGNPEQDSTAVVQTIWDEAVDQGLGNGVWEWRPESGDVLEVEKGGFGDGFDVWLEGECRV